MFSNGKRHGSGTITKKSVTEEIVIYTGDFENDHKSGNGTYTYENGDKYIGQWRNDHRNGFGTFITKNGH